MKSLFSTFSNPSKKFTGDNQVGPNGTAKALKAPAVGPPVLNGKLTEVLTVKQAYNTKQLNTFIARFNRNKS